MKRYAYDTKFILCSSLFVESLNSLFDDDDRQNIIRGYCFA